MKWKYGSTIIEGRDSFMSFLNNNPEIELMHSEKDSDETYWILYREPIDEEPMKRVFTLEEMKDCFEWAINEGAGGTTLTTEEATNEYLKHRYNIDL